jgi:hypothetical protein
MAMHWIVVFVVHVAQVFLSQNLCAMGKWPTRRPRAEPLTDDLAESSPKRQRVGTARGLSSPSALDRRHLSGPARGCYQRLVPAAASAASRGKLGDKRPESRASVCKAKRSVGTTRRSTTRLPIATMEALVGPVTETRKEHELRHGKGMRNCPRCRWYLWGHRWMASYGSISHDRAGPRKKVFWAAERPVRWGGAWGLGCTFCADSVARQTAQSRGDSGQASTSSGPRRRLGTNWARFDVRAKALQAEHLKQHSHYDLHKIAELAWLRPDEPVSLHLQADMSDDRLLAGAVPQPPDWLRAWRAAMTPVSWLAAAANADTEHFIARVRNRSVQPRATQKMLLVMRDVVRAEKRQWIKDATAISLSFDDRKGYKLIVFKCDMPLLHRGAQTQAESAQYARHGVLGCLDAVRGVSLEELSQDYAERTCEKIMSMVSLFSTPLGEGSPDDTICEKFRKATRSIIVDGALIKVAHLLKLHHMPNIVLVCRDPAHMVRIACSQPLSRTGRFEEQHARLFTSNHALLKDVQYSECWRSRLHACQELVVQKDGTQGGNVQNILRHFSYAPHRFESFAGPRRQYACLLQAIFLCLGGIVSDMRQNMATRRRAEAAMDSMTPRDILECGLAGDFGEVCVRCSGVTVRHCGFCLSRDVREESPSRQLLPPFRGEARAASVMRYFVQHMMNQNSHRTVLKVHS